MAGPDRRPATRQRGIALLILLVMTGILAVTLVMQLLPRQPSETRRDQVTQKALAQAKEALIAYAVSYMDQNPDDIPGVLPCPSTTAPTSANDEGIAEATCGAKYVSQLGRLPWKTLRTAPIQDGNGECLWYAVSGTFKGGSTRADMLNWDSLGQLKVLGPDGATIVAGASATSRAAAVIIAPGRSIDQNRSPSADTNQCPGNFTASNYLEAHPSSGSDNTALSTVANGVSQLINGSADQAVNDRMLVITPDEIFNAIRRRKDFIGTPADPGKLRRLARKVAECIASYPIRARLPPDAPDARLVFAGTMTPAILSSSVTYLDVGNRRQGRVPFKVYSTIGNTGYFIYDVITSCPDWTNVPEFANSYENYKDQLFYAVASDFQPVGANLNDTACSTNCLTVVDQGGTVRNNIAAVVFLAGPRLGNQNRTARTAADYLEGINATRFGIFNSGEDYVSGTETSTTLNDLAYCITVPSPGAPPGAPPVVSPC